MRARDVNLREVHRHDHDLFLVHRCLGQDLSGSARDEALAPEFQTFTAGRGFVADTICDRNIAAIRNAMAALDHR